jgi:hypothetical protein
LDNDELYIHWTLATLAVQDEFWDADQKGNKVLRLDGITHMLRRLFLTVGPEKKVGPEQITVRDAVCTQWKELAAWLPTYQQVINEEYEYCAGLWANWQFLRDWHATARELACRALSNRQLPLLQAQSAQVKALLDEGEAWQADLGSDFPRAHTRPVPDRESLKSKHARACRTASHAVIALMHAYLTLSSKEKEQASRNDYQLILRKDPETGSLIIGRNAAVRLYDVKEGSHTWDPDARRLHLMRRSAFIRSLVDLAEKLKIIDTSYHWWQNHTAP